MYIDKKYFSIMTGEGLFEHNPKFYLDFYTLKANLKRSYKDNASLVVRLGIFNKHLFLELKWGFVEREKNKHKIERSARAKKFLKDLE